jgi:hypothetical protein
MNSKALRICTAPRINSTISVFGSLLLFHTFEELLEHYVLPVARPHAGVAAGPEVRPGFGSFLAMLVGLKRLWLEFCKIRCV